MGKRQVRDRVSGRIRLGVRGRAPGAVCPRTPEDTFRQKIGGAA